MGLLEDIKKLPGLKQMLMSRPDYQKLVQEAKKVGTEPPAGIRIVESNIIPPGQMLITELPEFIGQIPIRQELSILPDDDPKFKVTGWQMSEHIGVGVINPKSISGISMERPTLIFEWPIPVFRGIWLRTSYYQGAMCLSMVAQGPIHQDTKIAVYDGKFAFGPSNTTGFDHVLPDMLRESVLASHEVKSAYLNQSIAENLAGDPFWQRYIDEVRTVFEVAQVMLT